MIKIINYKHKNKNKKDQQDRLNPNRIKTSKIVA